VIREALDRNALKEVQLGQFDIVLRVDEAERRALNWLSGAIERGIAESMSNELPDLIAAEKAYIMSRRK